jgi:succinyl-diaminopimelate desuccinylase
MSVTLELASDLIERASITPADEGCQALVSARLDPLGFACETLSFGDVTNLWARAGTQEGPLLAFIGHTDVVPTGPEDEWQTPPFRPTVINDHLHGRGAADMKGSVAAFVTACERVIGASGPPTKGSLAVLLTSDEEGPAQDGTRRVIEALTERGTAIDYGLVGEPSSESSAGDTIKIGRRGSLTGNLTVHGIQGHVAYPHNARNPVHEAAAALDALARTHWDDGNEAFPPTSFQIANVTAGTGASNVIPATLEVQFNFRYGTAATADELRQRVTDCLEAHDLEYSLDWHHSAEPFATPSGALVDATSEAVEAVTGHAPNRSTGGGTSDGRFVAPTGAQIVELGPLNATIHQVDERVGVAELEALTAMYEGVIRRLLYT